MTRRATYLMLNSSVGYECLERVEAEAVARRVWSTRITADPAALAGLLASLAEKADPTAVFAFWDAALGPLPWDLLNRFHESRDDAWHPGPLLSGRDEPDLFLYVEPTWAYRPDPEPDRDGVLNWKFDPRALFLKGRVLLALGGLDCDFHTLAGSMRALGLRWHLRGAVCRQQPSLLDGGQTVPIEPIPLVDRYRLLLQRHGRIWGRYVLIRRSLSGVNPRREIEAFRLAGRSSQTQADFPPVGAAHRPLDDVELPPRPRVSVVLPTFGRYRYVAELLDDLKRQTVPVHQILIADGNLPEERRPEVYERFADLPIEVLWMDRGGTCASRNACLERAEGDFIWFVDDDSRLDEDNLESHLRVLEAYGADVSVGPARTPRRSELHGYQREIACTFMDCGTTLCRQAILEVSGGFDLQFNEHLPGEDGELGVRFLRAGGLMLNNPLAQRFHYLAPVGGCRASGNNVHRWRRWSLSPRPARSVYYAAHRHFGPIAAREAILLAWVLAGFRRPEGVQQRRGGRLLVLLAEAAALPVSLVRLLRSLVLARRMIREGP